MKSLSVLRGIVVEVKKLGEDRLIQGKRWEKVIYTVKLVQFSKRESRMKMSEDLKGKEVKVLRFAHDDWHYKTGVSRTLTVEETEAVLKGTPTETVFW